MAVQTASGVLLGEGSGSQTAQAVWAFFQNTTFSREDETEADEVGLQISKEAGYDPFGLANFFKKLMAQGGNGLNSSRPILQAASATRRSKHPKAIWQSKSR